MKKKKKVSKPDPVFLSSAQVGDLIYGAVKNIIDLKTHVDDEGYKFLLILDCIVPEECIPSGQEPENEEESFDIMAAHTVLELSEYFDAILSVKQEDGVLYRGFSTVAIGQENMAAFVRSLSELEEYWAAIDQGIEDEESFKNKAVGKNLVQGNETIN